MQQTAGVKYPDAKRHHRTESTFISMFKYEGGIITIYFCDGSTIEYYPELTFPPNEPANLDEIYEGLRDATSIGKYWHKNVKNNHKLQVKRLR